jgi:hypothetical protein
MYKTFYSLITSVHFYFNILLHILILFIVLFVAFSYLIKPVIYDKMTSKINKKIKPLLKPYVKTDIGKIILSNQENILFFLKDDNFIKCLNTKINKNAYIIIFILITILLLFSFIFKNKLKTIKIKKILIENIIIVILVILLEGIFFINVGIQYEPITEEEMQQNIENKLFNYKYYLDNNNNKNNLFSVLFKNIEFSDDEIDTGKTLPKNKTLINKTIKYICIFLSVVILISFIIHFLGKNNIKTYIINIIFSNLFILIFIILTQYIFTQIILKNYKITSITDIYNNIIEVLNE